MKIIKIQLIDDRVGRVRAIIPAISISKSKDPLSVYALSLAIGWWRWGIAFRFYKKGT